MEDNPQEPDRNIEAMAVSRWKNASEFILFFFFVENQSLEMTFNTFSKDAQLFSDVGNVKKHHQPTPLGYNISARKVYSVAFS